MRHPGPPYRGRVCTLNQILLHRLCAADACARTCTRFAGESHGGTSLCSDDVAFVCARFAHFDPIQTERHARTHATRNVHAMMQTTRAEHAVGSHTRARRITTRVPCVCVVACVVSHLSRVHVMNGIARNMCVRCARATLYYIVNSLSFNEIVVRTCGATAGTRARKTALMRKIELGRVRLRLGALECGYFKLVQYIIKCRLRRQRRQRRRQRRHAVYRFYTNRRTANVSAPADRLVVVMRLTTHTCGALWTESERTVSTMSAPNSLQQVEFEVSEPHVIVYAIECRIKIQKTLHAYYNTFMYI